MKQFILTATEEQVEHSYAWLYALTVNDCMKRVAGKEHAHGIRMLQSLFLFWPQASVNPRYATIKCIVPLSAFKVQSAMSERSLVTHGQTMENTLGPTGIIIKMPGQSGRK